MGLVKTRRLAAMHPPPLAASTSAKATVDEPKDKEVAARILLRQGYGGLKAGMRPPCKDRKVPVPRAKFSSDPRRQ